MNHFRKLFQDSHPCGIVACFAEAKYWSTLLISAWSAGLQHPLAHTFYINSMYSWLTYKELQTTIGKSGQTFKKKKCEKFQPRTFFFHPETSSHQSTIGRHRFTNSSRSVRPVVPSSMHGSCTNGGGRWGSSDAKWNMGNLWLNSWGILRCQCLISNWFGWCLSSSIHFWSHINYQEVPTR